ACVSSTARSTVKAFPSTALTSTISSSIDRRKGTSGNAPASSTMNTVSVSLTACASTVSALFFALSLAIEFHLKVADCIHDLLIFDYFRFVDGCICELRTACLRIKYSRTGYRATIFFSNRKSDFVIVYYAPI